MGISPDKFPFDFAIAGVLVVGIPGAVLVSAIGLGAAVSFLFVSLVLGTIFSAVAHRLGASPGNVFAVSASICALILFLATCGIIAISIEASKHV